VSTDVVCAGCRGRKAQGYDDDEHPEGSAHFILLSRSDLNWRSGSKGQQESDQCPFIDAGQAFETAAGVRRLARVVEYDGGHRIAISPMPIGRGLGEIPEFRSQELVCRNVVLPEAFVAEERIGAITYAVTPEICVRPDAKRSVWEGFDAAARLVRRQTETDERVKIGRYCGPGPVVRIGLREYPCVKG